MNWNFFVGPGSVLLGMLIALYVKDQAHEVIKKEFSNSIAAVLATFKMDLLKSLDDTYTRSGECKLMMEQHDDRLDILSERMDLMEKQLYQIKPTQRD